MAETDSELARQDKILFVDDEENILKSIRRSLFGTEMQIYTAPGGEEGLKILEKEGNIDIVVSDYRMPGINGLKFLEEVKHKYDSANRVILSGYIDQSVVLKALTTGLASTFFEKPWRDDILINRLAHILSVRKTLRNKKLFNLLKSIDRLPPLPAQYQKLIKAIEEDRSIKDIAEIISEDTAMSAKILQIANSAFYGAKGIHSIKNAIVHLGLAVIKDLILVFGMTGGVQWKDDQIDRVRMLFLHSSIVNTYIPIFYKMIYNAEVGNSYPSIGITHDIGKIIILGYLPKHYESVINYQKMNPGKSFFESEIALDFKETAHNVIGAYFLDMWNLPEVFVEAALYHHNPQESSESNRKIISALSYAKRIISYLSQTDQDEDLDLAPFNNDLVDPQKLNEIAVSIKQDLQQGKSMIDRII